MAMGQGVIQLPPTFQHFIFCNVMGLFQRLFKVQGLNIELNAEKLVKIDITSPFLFDAPLKAGFLKRTEL